ncbi:MAG: hypothetical protein M3Q98_11320 [Actinomycetota bacterium]|nr:hypothetical protein [Actinomycetota bacterium]
MTKNPWLPEAPLPTEPTTVAVVATTGATAPQPAVTPPEAGDQLRTFATTTQAGLWVVGTHGGAGESTVAQLLAGNETGHRWPDTSPAPAVLLTARTHAAGLRAAQTAMRAWAAGQTPHIRLLGLVLVADAPGKLPRTLAVRAEILNGGVPHTWLLPWVDEYRIDVDPADPPRQVRKVLNEITTVLSNSTI